MLITRFPAGPYRRLAAILLKLLVSNCANFRRETRTSGDFLISTTLEFKLNPKTLPLMQISNTRGGIPVCLGSREQAWACPDGGSLYGEVPKWTSGAGGGGSIAPQTNSKEKFSSHWYFSHVFPVTGSHRRSWGRVPPGVPAQLPILLPPGEHAPADGAHAGKRCVHPGECVCVCVCMSVCLRTCTSWGCSWMQENDVFILVSLSGCLAVCLCVCLSENMHQLRVLMQENDVLILMSHY